MKTAKKKKADKAAPAGDTDEGLQNEISAYASQLGLNAGIQTGFNDSDFRPEVATKQIGSKAKQKTGTPRKDEDNEQEQHLAQRRKSSQQAGPSGRAEKRPEIDEKLDAVKGRKWNLGSGVRPGEKAGKTLIGKDEPVIWHEALTALPPLPKPKPGVAIDDWALEKLRSEGEAALENEARVFEQDLGRRNQADSRWLQQVRQSGTTADKLAALTLLVQESAVANMKSLDELLKWVGKRSGARGVAGQAIDALKELFTRVLLPSRKLLFFEQQPLAALPAGNEGRHRLMYYYMEDAIKKRYLHFVKDLQEASRDNLAFIKEKAIKAIYDLLKSNPEQEALLLSNLVDKLGDPSRKIASNAGYLLGQLLEEHPAMGMVVVQETERFLFKAHTPAKAIYYGVVFLNQIVLTKRRDEGGSPVAKKLIGLYFTLFKLILQGKVGQAHELQAKKEEQEARKGLKGGVKKKARWKARSGQNAEGKANGRRVEASAKRKDPPKSQVAAVDAKLLGALLAGVRRAFPFVESADAAALMDVHSASLFTVTHNASFGVAVQALSLLFQLLDAGSAVSDRFYRALYGMLLHPESARSNKSAMFLSLVFKAMKADVSLKRIVAFIKRLLQVAAGQAPNFTCGCLLLISEVMKEKPSLWSYITEPEEADDLLERFDDGIVENSQGLEQVEGDEDSKAQPLNGRKASPKSTPHQAYDMYKRDPTYSGADQTCLWELVLLAEHVHPSVAAMTKALLAGVPVDYAGDPIRDMSSAAFLDKFIQKKPKVQQKGSSLMQPPAKPEFSTPAFAALSAADAAPDTAYFHKFFEVKAAREAAGQRPTRKKKRAKDDEAAEGPLGGDDDEDSLADSEAASEEIDAFMDNVEESDEEAGGYDQLAAAMAADAPPETSSSGSEEAGDVSSGEETGKSDGEGDVPEDVDAFKLASPSEGESSSGQEESSEGGDWIMADMQDVQAGADSGLPDRHDDSDLEDPFLGDEDLVSLSEKGKKGKSVQSRKRGKDESVFAPAADYAHLIDNDRPVRKPKKKSRKASVHL